MIKALTKVLVSVCVDYRWEGGHSRQRDGTEQAEASNMGWMDGEFLLGIAPAENRLNL